MYNQLANEEVLKTTTNALKEKGYLVSTVKNGASALEKIKTLIPKGSSVINGASITLEKIGYTDYVDTPESGWNNLHTKVNSESDPLKRAKLRREATVSDFYLGSVHALTQKGDFIIASNTGSQIPSVAFSSTNLILVVGTQKIVPDLDTAMKRLADYIVPLEEVHMQKKYGVGTNISKVLIFKNEVAYLGRKVNIILVKETLGF